MNWFKALSMGSVAFGWFTKAAADGRITGAEVVELVESLISLFGVHIELPDELNAMKDQGQGKLPM